MYNLPNRLDNALQMIHRISRRERKKSLCLMLNALPHNAQTRGEVGVRVLVSLVYGHFDWDSHMNLWDEKRILKSFMEGKAV